MADYFPSSCLKRDNVLGVPINLISWDRALSLITLWVSQRSSRYICICNVHSVISANHDDSFKNVVVGADLVTPDGAPIAWMLRKLGHTDQQRINGPDLMWAYCEAAAKRNESIFLYGGTEDTLVLLKEKLLSSFNGLVIAGSISPPFRALTVEEDDAYVLKINESGAGTVWVSLGCPKQEAWMASHRGKVQAVMIGVGAAFDYHAGTIKRAPLWMQKRGLEWLHRLCSEPRRLWKRYFVTNTLFVIGAIKQLIFKI